jgi:hypothetical protein
MSRFSVIPVTSWRSQADAFNMDIQNTAPLVFDQPAKVCQFALKVRHKAIRRLLRGSMRTSASSSSKTVVTTFSSKAA